MPALLLAFTAASILATAFELWLRWRQVAYVQCRADAVSAGFSAVCTPEQHRRAAAYELVLQRVGAASEAFGLLVALG